ncbi:MAG TPA: CocE/NonD family hydrolase [Acidimicrobiia bacterium]|nr:CocE/NonD family hydrolase [Acidimicrobiia bacterium]
MTLSDSPANAQASTDLVTEEVSFSAGDGVTLHGTIVAPVAQRPLPGLVLVHGGGPATREWHRQEAEAFARAGIVTLIYDKRTDGYSLFDRSYAQLAEDVLAAHALIQAHEDVDPTRVGLWGVSEGGWIAPLAASSSDRVAFLVTVGANGIPPAQQEGWAKANRLRRGGVTGSMLRSYTITAVRVLADAGFFPEAYYDPIPVLERLRQPVLGIWGEQEQVSPPSEGLSMFAAALGRGGNSSYTLKIVAGGDHAAYLSPDGGFATQHWITAGGRFAPGYIELVGSWIHGLAEGPPAPSADNAPEQEMTSTPLPPLEWYESSAVQLVAISFLAVTFAGYLLGTVVRRSRKRPPTPPAAQSALWLAASGLLTVLGLLGYFGIMLLTSEAMVGPVVLGRTIPWITLQLLSLGVVVAAVATGRTWWRTRSQGKGSRRARLGLLITAATLFVPWALYWGLLLP